MPADTSYTVPEAHRLFGVELHQETWRLLETPERTPEEDERMVYAVHGSCRHWLEAGTPVHHQRGEWLIARVYTVLDNAPMALRHAQRCLDLTLAHTDKMEDFDRAFACEGFARAHALAGSKRIALEYIAKAQAAADAIEDDEDRAIFFADFNGGNWYGLR